jgi:hypothetical protein
MKKKEVIPHERRMNIDMQIGLYAEDNIPIQ